MKGKIAGAALAAAVVTTLVAATPAAAAPLPTAANGMTAATYLQHHGADGDKSDAQKAVTYTTDLVTAWGDVDTTTVDKLATPEVADTLLGFSNPDGATWAHTSSRAIGGIMFSSYVNRDLGKALVLGAQLSLIDGDHAVVIARFVDYAKNKMTPVQYAKDLVAAWGEGDTDAVNKLATPDVSATLLGFADPGGTAWRYTCSREIAGIVFSSFVDTTQGKAVVIGVEKAAIGDDHAAVIGRVVDYQVHRGSHADNMRWHHGDKHWWGDKDHR